LLAAVMRGGAVDSGRPYAQVNRLDAWLAQENILFGQLYLPGALYSLSAPAGDLLGRMLRDMLSQGEERQPQRRVGHSLLALFCQLLDNPTKFHAALL